MARLRNFQFALTNCSLETCYLREAIFPFGVNTWLVAFLHGIVFGRVSLALARGRRRGGSRADGGFGYGTRGGGILIHGGSPRVGDLEGEWSRWFGIRRACGSETRNQ